MTINQVKLDPVHAEVAGEIINILKRKNQDSDAAQICIAMAMIYIIENFQLDAESTTRMLARNIKVFSTRPELKQAVLDTICREIKGVISLPSKGLIAKLRGALH